MDDFFCVQGDFIQHKNSVHGIGLVIPYVFLSWKGSYSTKDKLNRNTESNSIAGNFADKRTDISIVILFAFLLPDGGTSLGLCLDVVS